MRLVARLAFDGAGQFADPAERLGDAVRELGLRRKFQFAGMMAAGADAAELFARMLELTSVATDTLELTRDNRHHRLQRIEMRLNVLLVGLRFVKHLHAAQAKAVRDAVHILLRHARTLDGFFHEPFAVALETRNLFRAPDALLKFDERRHAAHRQAHLVKRAQNVCGLITFVRASDQLDGLPDLVLRPQRVKSLARQNDLAAALLDEERMVLALVVH